MQSNNPVFRARRSSTGRLPNAYGNQTYAGNGAAHPGYGQPAGDAPTGTGTPDHHRAADDDRLGRPEDRHRAASW